MITLGHKFIGRPKLKGALHEGALSLKKNKSNPNGVSGSLYVVLMQTELIAYKSKDTNKILGVFPYNKAASAEKNDTGFPSATPGVFELTLGDAYKYVDSKTAPVCVFDATTKDSRDIWVSLIRECAEYSNAFPPAALKRVIGAGSGLEKPRRAVIKAVRTVADKVEVELAKFKGSTE